jgi:hypothetical protein
MKSIINFNMNKLYTKYIKGQGEKGITNKH